MANKSAALEKFVKAVGAAVLLGGAVVVIAPLAAAFGWFAGWTVSWFLGDMLTDTLAQIGIHNITPPHLGAQLAFVGSFLRTSVKSQS